MGDTLQAIYSVFDPAPLRDEQQDLFVDLDPVRGGWGIVGRMAQKIRLAEGPTCQVLTGHRGSGKSTELWRLRRELEDPGEGAGRMFVVQVQADNDLDRNDIDFPDVLIAIVRQVAEQLRARAGIDLKPGYFKDRWQRLKDLLGTDISFDSIDLDTGMATLSATIKNSPEARARVREALEPDTNNWLHAANDVIGEAVLRLREKGYRGLVVMVDDLDKMITRPHESAGCNTTEYLFVHRSAQLAAFHCHLIYTLPIELAYSHHEPTIRRLYGGHLPVVPMTKLSTPPPRPRPYRPGIEKFRGLIRARLAHAGVAEGALFRTDRVRDDLIRLTGGQPTELMTLIREALVTEGLPVGTAGLRRSRTEAMRSYRRQLRADHWPMLDEVRRTGQVVRTLDNETAFRELLESRALLLYVNKQEWYALNPAVADLPAPVLPPADPAP
jgi:hypothetical protein